MTLTENEKKLVSGDRDKVYEFADSDECISVDHRAEEEGIFADVAERLPKGYFEYEFDDEQFFSVTCGGATDEFELELSRKDRYRALRFINDMLTPDYEMKILKCRFDDDTHSFLLRPIAWWEEFSEVYADKMEDLFVDIDETTDFH